AGPSVSIAANSTDTSFAKSTAGSGGLIAGEGAVANVNVDAVTRAYLQDGTSGAPQTTLNVSSLAVNATHTENFDSQTDTIQASAVGFSGSWAINTINSTTEAIIGSYSKITTQNLDVTAENNINKNLVPSGQYNVDAGSGGAIEGSAAESETSISNYTHALINDYVTIDENGSASAPGDFVLSAMNNIVATDSVLLDSGGAIVGSGVVDWINANTNQAYAGIGNNDTISTVGAIDLETCDTGNISVTPDAHVYGLASVASMDAQATMQTDDEVNVGDNTNITAQGNLNFYAGQLGPDGPMNSFVINDYATELNGCAIPISSISAYGAAIQNESINIGQNSNLLTSKDANLVTQLDGDSIITSYYKGTNWLTDITGSADTGGTSTQTANGTVTVGANSEIEVGWNNIQTLTISYDANGDIVYGGTLAAPGNNDFTTTTENLGADLVNQYNYLLEVMQAYQGDATVYDGYLQQLDYVEAQMTSMGLSTTQSGTTIYSTAYAAQFVTVGDISAQEGTINIVGSKLTMNGTLSAVGNVAVNITNSTAADLRISDIDISDEAGGDVTFNTAQITDLSSVAGVSGSGKIISAQAGNAPTINISSTFTAGSPGNPAGTENCTTPEIDLVGNISNILGSVTVTASGNVTSEG
ncbi:MAG: hypothetical protein WAK26_14945, partial [Terracidiphilus sp.]